MYQLVATELSYFSGKIRSYLRYKEIPFEEVLSCQKVFEKVVIPKTKVRYIPILICPNGTAVQDTTDIIDYLEGVFPRPSVYPSSPRQRFACLLLELFADEWLKLPAMHYRWSFEEQLDFLMFEFGKGFMPEADLETQVHFAKTISAPFRGSLPFLGIDENTKPEVEKLYLSVLSALNSHFKTNRYILGDRPSLVDFAFMGPLYAHLFRDPVPGSIMKCKAPLVAEWVERMNGLLPSRVFLHDVDENGRIYRNQAPGTDVRGYGEFLPNDEIPLAVENILKIMVDQQFPILIETARQLKVWLQSNSDKSSIPRVIGDLKFKMGNSMGTKKVFPYEIWMLQRAVDYYNSLDVKDKQSVDLLLKSVGGQESFASILAEVPKCRVKRKENILVQDIVQSKL